MKDALIEQDILDRLKDPKQKAKAFNDLVILHQERVYWQIRKMVLVHDDANDVMQNSFIKAWNAIDNFRADAKLSTWLYRIAINESLTHLSKQRQNNSSGIAEVEDILLERLEADEFFDGDELQLKLQKAILSLPEKQRMVFNMKYFDEMKYEQMSEILQTSVGALKASFHHAVKKIEAYFKEEE